MVRRKDKKIIGVITLKDLFEKMVEKEFKDEDMHVINPIVYSLPKVILFFKLI